MPYQRYICNVLLYIGLPAFALCWAGVIISYITVHQSSRVSGKREIDEQERLSRTGRNLKVRDHGVTGRQ